MANLREWIQLIALIVGMAGALFAAYKGIYEIRASTDQRKDDLRWRRANTAKELLSEIHRHPNASNAVRMMDWSEGTHEYLVEDKSHMISYLEVITVLRKGQGKCISAVERFIRDSFDWFFYDVDRTEHYIRSGLIDFQDVAHVFEPYATKIHEHEDVYETFMTDCRYDLAKQFWKRYTPAQSASGS